jgi:hypothetical protein
MLFIGYFLGRYVPGIDRHIEKVIIVVIFLRFFPESLDGFGKGKRNREPGTGNRAPLTRA